LDESTRQPLFLTLETHLVKNQTQIDFILSGFDKLMAESQKEDLALMYDLLSRVDALPQLKQSFTNYVTVR